MIYMTFYSPVHWCVVNIIVHRTAINDRIYAFYTLQQTEDFQKYWQGSKQTRLMPSLDLPVCPAMWHYRGAGYKDAEESPIYLSNVAYPFGK
jgi:hypothetical protein